MRVGVFAGAGTHSRPRGWPRPRVQGTLVTEGAFSTTLNSMMTRLLLLLTSGLAGCPVTKANDISRVADKRPDDHVSRVAHEGPQAAPPVLILVGRIEKKLTVGYRSPFRLIVTDAKSRAQWQQADAADATVDPLEIELRRQEPLIDTFLGQEKRVYGRYILQPGGRAEPGSEAASRFVDGYIPSLVYLEVKEIRNP